MRIGSREDDSQQLSNLRKMLIFKGAAYNQASGEIPNILASKILLTSLGVSCPNLATSSNPACSGLYAYYSMSAAEVTNGQTVVDSSGNSKDATNGSSLSVDSDDCTRYSAVLSLVRPITSTSQTPVRWASVG